MNQAQLIMVHELSLSTRQCPSSWLAARGSAPQACGRLTVTAECLQVKIVNLTDDTLGAVIDTAVKTGGNLLNIDYIQVRGSL